MTGICSLGLATLSIAEDVTHFSYSNTVENIRSQKLDRSFSRRFGLSNILSSSAKPRPNQAISSSTTKSSAEKLALVSKYSHRVGKDKLSPLPISAKVVDLIKEFEGFETQAYVDTDGTPVIGYGLSKIAGKSVQIGDRISPLEADKALNAQLQEIQRQLNSSVKVKLTEAQLGALTSLSFNVGVDSVKQSTLVKKLNVGDYTGAANEFLRWDKANVEGSLVQLPGLTRRRQAERQLFLQ